MPECRRKVSSASAFLPVVSCLSPASVFRHQGSVRYRLSRISPALPSYGQSHGNFCVLTLLCTAAHLHRLHEKEISIFELIWHLLLFYLSTWAKYSQKITLSKYVRMRAAAVVRAWYDPRIFARGEEGTWNIFGGILYAIFQKVKQLLIMFFREPKQSRTLSSF